MMKYKTTECPKCGSADVLFVSELGKYLCKQCEQTFEGSAPIKPLRIFLSYGHDRNEELVSRIKADLEQRGHDVWFDKSEIKGGDDWRRSITEGIVDSSRVLSFLSKHSTRDPGVCLDEIAIAVGVKGGNIQTILVESEQEVKPPASISHIQWLDMHYWKEEQEAGEAEWEEWYQKKLAEIVAVVESDESRRFSGEIEELAQHLKPISSDSRIRELLRKPLVGRAWLVDAIEEWRTETPSPLEGERAGVRGESRLFWIMGAPGVGKSAFAAHLAHFGKDKVLAVQFCQYDKPDHRSAHRIVRTLAFQIATRLPDYRKLLLTLPELKELDPKNSSELFDYLLADPLRNAIDGGRERYLIVIDALDEAGGDGRNELVEMLARNASRLPDWIGFVVTSRPEFDVIGPLQGLRPFRLDTATESNRADISHYLCRQLGSHLENRPDADGLLDQILEKSEGVFLYVERFCDDIRRGHLSLDDPTQFPQGLGGIFFQYFQRQFPDLEKFREEVRPALQAILAAREPLPIEILQRLFDWQYEELRDFLRPLGSLFPVLTESGVEVVKPYHKSLLDWLEDEAKTGPYFVSSLEGHRVLTMLGWQSYTSAEDSLHDYFLAHLPRHCLMCREWSKAVSLLTDIAFLEDKVGIGLAFDLVVDFADARRLLPEDNPHRRVVALIEESLRRDIHFIVRHAHDQPQSLFQCLWNSCWWWDCTEASGHFRAADSTSSEPHVGLSELVERWYAVKKKERKTWFWVRSLRPPEQDLGGAQLAILRGHDDVVNAISFSPDGQRIATGSGNFRSATDKSVRLWDVGTGKEIALLGECASRVTCVSHSPDGQTIASGSEDGKICLWDARKLLLTAAIDAHQRAVNSICYSPDGTHILSASDDKTVRIWNADSGEQVMELGGHTGSVFDAACFSDGRTVITASDDGTARVWNRRTGEQIAAFSEQPHAFPIYRVAVSAGDSAFATAAGDFRFEMDWHIRVRASTGAEVCHIDRSTGLMGPIRGLGFFGHGNRLLSASDVHMLQIWDAEDGHLLTTFRGHEGVVEDIAVSTDGNQVASSSTDKTVRVWNPHAIPRMRTLVGPTSNVTCVEFSPSGDLVVSGSLEGDVQAWDSQHGRLVSSCNVKSIVMSLAFSPDGRFVAIGNGRIWVWDLSRGSLSSLADHPSDGGMIGTGVQFLSGISQLLFSSDGERIVSFGGDNTVRIWNAKDGSAVACIDGVDSPNDAIHWGRYYVRGFTNTTISMTPNGRFLIVKSEDDVRAFDMASGTQVSLPCATETGGDGIRDQPAKGRTSQKPYKIAIRDGITAITDALTGQDIAAFPVAIKQICSSPDGQTWAGAVGSHVFLIRLERVG